MNINELTKQAHEDAVGKGFYGCPECEKNHTIENFNQNGDLTIVNPDCHECTGTGINPKRNIGELLMLIVSELSEALEAHRKNRLTSNLAMEDKLDGYLECITSGNKNMIDESIKFFENYIKDTFEDEIADTFIRLADLCGYLNIDIEKHIIAKMAYNKTRNHKHGKKY